MTVAEILENVKDIDSDVLSKDVRQALGVEKRSGSELTDGFEEIAKQERADIQSRGGVVVETREELLRHIHNALETNEQKTIFLGKISEELKQRIAQEAGDSSLFKNGEYAFGISYDNIGHIQKHFSEIED